MDLMYVHGNAQSAGCNVHPATARIISRIREAYDHVFVVVHPTGFILITAHTYTIDNPGGYFTLLVDSHCNSHRPSVTITANTDTSDTPRNFRAVWVGDDIASQCNRLFHDIMAWVKSN